MIHKNKSKKRLIIGLSCCFLAALILFGVIFITSSSSKVSKEITIGEAEKIVNSTFSTLSKTTALSGKAVLNNLVININDIKYGTEKDVILNCEYSTVDIASVVEANKQSFIDSAYRVYTEENANATKIGIKLSAQVSDAFSKAKPVSGKIELILYEVSDGEFKLYLTDDVVDKCTGGFLSANKTIDEIKTAYDENGNKYDITNSNTLRTGVKYCWDLINYDSEKPDTGNWLQKNVNAFVKEFNRNFVEGDRWLYLLQGLRTTLAITAVSGIMGMVLGFIVAIIRCTHETTGKLYIIDKFCKVYLTIIRGTPVMVQLLIIYFVLLLPLGVPKFISAVLCFGLNSGAYVAEIVRGGIMSVDKGQNEAGRSLGFNYPQTMIHFIIPQAFKAVLPSLANEFITLLKESSVAFYIGVADLTQGGLKIRSITYSNFMPLIAVALVYLLIVLILTKAVSLLERRLHKSDH